MTNVRTLEERVNDLEKRLTEVEGVVFTTKVSEDKEWMGVLYKMAKDLVVKHKKASTIFLQKKLLIDNMRAIKLLEELEANGVVGPVVGFEQREVLADK